jgi:purine-binding chemotaxis protein CheW
MILPQRIVVFSLDDGRFGFDVTAIERVLPAVAITPLPQAPAIVLGVFNLHGRVIPVVDVRRRFQLPERAVSPDDQFIVARAGSRTLALVVDATVGVLALSATDVVPPQSILAPLPHVRGVVRLPDGLVLVHDLETFLALDEAAALSGAMQRFEQKAAVG